MIPDFGDDSLVKAFQISASARAEAWVEAIAQARTLEAVGLLEDRLHKRLALLRDREAPNDTERNALALCAERREEIAADAAMRPGASGKSTEALSAMKDSQNDRLW
jgi:hypothetical protein